MKLVYTNPNGALVGSARNILEDAGIAVTLKHEHSGGYPGLLGVYPELWVVNDSDQQRAIQLIESALSPADAEEWLCGHCNEKNDASFELCWNCKRDKGCVGH